ncbi:hypothetical protein G6F40_016028 [Rhizopus arrhizus]|nr:hypothetical protein G6F40_016028 [Rhizopus arrhizus]
MVCSGWLDSAVRSYSIESMRWRNVRTLQPSALLTEGCAEFGRQRLGDPDEGKLSVARALPSHLVHMDATPDSPVQQSELGVDGPVHTAARRADQLSEISQQFLAMRQR